MRNGMFAAVMGLILCIIVIGLVALSRVIDKHQATEADNLQIEYQIDHPQK